MAKARLQHFLRDEHLKTNALRLSIFWYKEVAGIMDMFEMMDLNEDKMISFDELKLGLHKLAGASFTQTWAPNADENVQIINGSGRQQDPARFDMEFNCFDHFLQDKL